MDEETTTETDEEPDWQEITIRSDGGGIAAYDFTVSDSLKKPQIHGKTRLMEQQLMAG